MPATATRRQASRHDRVGPSFGDDELKSGVDRILNRRPAVGLAVGVVSKAGLEAFHARGLADIASGRPITPDTVFRIASITKTFTAVAVMQLWEQGLVDLDAPANEYLRAYKLFPAKLDWRPATIRHLLTHTAGLAEVARPLGVLRPDWGESWPAGEPMPSLAEFYRGGLRLRAEPGTSFTYGNHGPATLGQLVEDVSREPLDRYFRAHIFEPLGMTDSDLLRTRALTSRLATGYTLGRAGAKPVVQRDMVTAGAASIYSTPRDLARYVAALLGGGANEHGRVLGPETVALMFAPHYQPDPRIPGMGLAFFRVDLGGHRVVEHQGTMPGFDSQVILAPDDGVGVVAFTNGARQPMLWLPYEVSGLLRQIVGARDDTVRDDLPQRPDLWGELCGWYRLPGPLTDIRKRAMLGAGAEVFVRGGQLMLRFLGPIPAMLAGFPLRPDDPGDPYVFRADLFEAGSARIVFSREPRVGITALHMDLMPLSFRRSSAATNPRRWATGILGALAVVGTAVALRPRR